MEMDDDDDGDFALALQLQEEYTRENAFQPQGPEADGGNTRVVDNSLELSDPTPDIYVLFQQFDQTFFESKLQKIEVRWSPRMTLCAGLCCYEGYGGLCSIRLSKPLLALRPRKDTVETLLHEMIHAFLFVTNNDKDHDAHGPEFLSHMKRINSLTGAHISVFHSFHDEVDAVRTHWWKCDGLCQKRAPYHGVVKRSMNRIPGPRDVWWADHERTCGGQFTKIKEPEAKGGTGKSKNKPKTASAVESRKMASSGDKFMPFSGAGHRLTSPQPSHHRPISSYFKAKGAKKSSGAGDDEADEVPAPKATALSVTCPVCASNIPSDYINDHLDNCLN